MPKYSDFFYKRYAAGSRRSAEIILPMIVDLVKPDSVVDVGCGIGSQNSRPGALLPLTAYAGKSGPIMMWPGGMRKTRYLLLKRILSLRMQS